MIAVTCLACQKKLSVKEDLAGKRAKCPGCGQIVPVPTAVTAEIRTVPSAPGTERAKHDLPTIPPKTFDAGAKLTHPPPSHSEATVGPRVDASHDSSLTDFLAPPQSDDELGRLGDYRILKILGHGGMGVVFLGEDPKLGRKVAIKAMLPYLAASKSAQQRFLREARAAAALQHDHVVAIHHVGEDRGAPFIVMPLLQGEPLDARLQRLERLPLAEVLRIGREIAKALAAAHAIGLIHRDIKPANIWLEQAQGQPSLGVGRVKILDFGLARAVADEASLTQQGAVIGTPAYMAPEQARGDPVDARCDLFSFGVVLYRLCSGRLPFRGKDTVSTLIEVATHEPAPPKKLNGALPQELSDLVMKLLEKDPARRIGTANEVIQVLGKLEKQQASGSTGETTMTYDSSEQPAAAARKSGRAPLLFACAALIFFGLLALGGALAYQFFFRIPNGTLVVNVDGDADVRFKNGKLLIYTSDGEKLLYTLTASEKNKTLPLGKYQVKVDGADGVTLETPEFTITRGGAKVHVIVQRTLEKKEPEKGPLAHLGAPDLTKAKVLYRDTFDNPKSGFPHGIKDDACEAGYDAGKYVIKVNPRSLRTCGNEKYANFACAVTGRMIDPVSGQWGLYIFADGPKHGIAVSINWDGKLNVKPDPSDVDKERGPRLGPFYHEAIKKGAEANTLLVVVRGRLVEVYVNSTAVTSFIMDRDITPGYVSLSAFGGAKGAHVEFTNYTIWSAAGLPAAAVAKEPIAVPPEVKKAAKLPAFIHKMGMQFAKVPKGKAWLGGGGGKEGTIEVNVPHDFYLGVYEVTQEEWEKVMKIKHSFHFSRKGKGKNELIDVTDDDLKRFPVENVSWNECQLFLKKLNEIDPQPGWEYRLPTEAEWEYACRGGPGDKFTSAFNFYIEEPTNILLLSQANFDDEEGGMRTCKVGSYPSNKLGLCDMHGNVSELTHDDQPDKDDAGNPKHNERGGGWTNSGLECKASGRFAWPPGEPFRDVGLRVARVPIAKTESRTK